MAAVATAEAYFGYGLPRAAGLGGARSFAGRTAHRPAWGRRSPANCWAHLVVLTNSAGVYAEAMADTCWQVCCTSCAGSMWRSRQQRAATWDQRRLSPAGTRCASWMRPGAGGGCRWDRLGGGAALLGAGVRVYRDASASRAGVPAGFARMVGPESLDASWGWPMSWCWPRHRPTDRYGGPAGRAPCGVAPGGRDRGERSAWRLLDEALLAALGRRAGCAGRCWTYSAPKPLPESSRTGNIRACW
jgi:hypothetical protein